MSYISVEYLWGKKTTQNLKPKPTNQPKNASHTSRLFGVASMFQNVFVIVCVVLQKVCTPLLCLYESKFILFFS